MSLQGRVETRSDVNSLTLTLTRKLLPYLKNDLEVNIVQEETVDYGYRFTSVFIGREIHKIVNGKDLPEITIGDVISIVEKEIESMMSYWIEGTDVSSIIKTFVKNFIDPEAFINYKFPDRTLLITCPACEGTFTSDQMFSIQLINTTKRRQAIARELLKHLMTKCTAHEGRKESGNRQAIP